MGFAKDVVSRKICVGFLAVCLCTYIFPDNFYVDREMCRTFTCILASPRHCCQYTAAISARVKLNGSQVTGEKAPFINSQSPSMEEVAEVADCGCSVEIQAAGLAGKRSPMAGSAESASTCRSSEHPAKEDPALPGGHGSEHVGLTCGLAAAAHWKWPPSGSDLDGRWLRGRQI